MDLNKTGLFISTLRKQKNMTQKDLADKLGVTDKAVSRWETGKGFPDVSFLMTLAETLGVSVTEIIKGERMVSEDKDTLEQMDKDQIKNMKPLKPLLDNLSFLGYVLIAAASSGYYEFVMLNRGAPFIVWVLLGIAGGVCLVLRNREYYKQHGNIPSLIIDIIFALAVLLIPKIPLNDKYTIVGYSTRIMQVTALLFIPIYVFILSPWKKHKKINVEDKNTMNKRTIKSRIIWAVGSVIMLCISFMLCRFTFLYLHGSYDWPMFLFILGLIALAISAIRDVRRVMVCTVIGYIGGFALGIIFGVDGVDYGGGGTNNWWFIWGCLYFAAIAVGVIWEVVSRQIKKKPLL